MKVAPLARHLFIPDPANPRWCRACGCRPEAHPAKAEK